MRAYAPADAPGKSFTFSGLRSMIISAGLRRSVALLTRHVLNLDYFEKKEGGSKELYHYHDGLAAIRQPRDAERDPSFVSMGVQFCALGQA